MAGESQTTDKNSTEELRRLAQQASSNAYAPYSGIQVGAMAVAAGGEVFAGCNVENASYGLTQCAERNALFTAIAAGIAPGEIHTMVIYSNGFKTLSPCGACRQVMSELMQVESRVISCSESQPSRSWTIDELLPDSFKLPSNS